jgi:hypothetical protein
VADDVARIAGKPRPVGPELELHRDAGHHADREVDAEDPDPESRRFVPPLAAPAQAEGLHHDDEKGQAHRQDREEVVVDDGERELEAVQDDRVAHLTSSTQLAPGHRTKPDTKRLSGIDAPTRATI